MEQYVKIISNLSFVSKVVETAGMNQILDHCNRMKLMPSYQSAYRPNHSCETALLKIVNDILWSMEHQKITALICMDLSAAFDTVDHEILLFVLEHKFGLKGNVLRWISEYLENRRMMVVCVGNKYSDVKIFNYSVPQGSCNGPAYFTLYSSILRNVIDEELDLNAFADNHTLKCDFKPGQSESETISCIERNLHYVQ